MKIGVVAVVSVQIKVTQHCTVISLKLNFELNRFMVLKFESTHSTVFSIFLIAVLLVSNGSAN